MKIALIYTIFAAIATAANILSQEISLRLYDAAFSVTLSIMVGTAVGLVVKYGLDKKSFSNTRRNRWRTTAAPSPSIP